MSSPIKSSRAKAGYFGLGLILGIALVGSVFLYQGVGPLLAIQGGDFQLTIYIAHPDNGSMTLTFNKSFLPAYTLQGNDTFGVPLGYCKMLTASISNGDIKYQSETYLLNGSNC